MQIVQWLFNLAHDPNKGTTKDQEEKSRDIISRKQRRSSKSKKLRPFIFVCNKDVAKACFYSSIYLRRADRHNTGQHCDVQSMKMKKEDNHSGREIVVVNHKPELASSTHAAAAAGNRVLPLSNEAALSSSSSNEKKQVKLKGDKTKTMSRMKELLRWAAAAKSEKGGKFIGRKVLAFRNRGGVKAVGHGIDDEVSNESPKISFRWDEESCSAISTCSALTATSAASSLNLVSLNSTPVHGLNRCSSRRGNWITTDAEFVVLEL